MNKEKVVEKTLNKLRMLKKNVKKESLFYRQIQLLMDVLMNKKMNGAKYLADFYEVINIILNMCHLDILEKGYIVSSIFLNNTSLISSQEYTFCMADNYAIRFSKFGIPREAIGQVYLDYLDNKDVSPSFKIFDSVEKFMDRLLKSDEQDLYYLSLRASKNFSMAKDSQSSILELRRELILINKNEQALHTAFQTKDLFIKLKAGVINVLNLSGKEVERILISYIIHGNLDLEREEKKRAFQTFLQEVKERSEIERLKYVDFYQKILDFVNASNRDITHYQMIAKAMNEFIPLELAEAFLWYYLELDTVKKEIPLKKEKTKKLSRNQLKAALRQYYDQRQAVPFDYNNFDHLLEILKDLNQADSANESIFADVLRNAIKNPAYYKFLYEKEKFQGSSVEVREELDYYWELMSCASNEAEYLEFQREALSLCNCLGIEANSFEYEMGLLLSKKSKIK